MQAVLFLPLKCAGGIILGTSMPPPLPLLLLLNHSQCASPSWPRMERERKLSVRDNILIPILYYCTNSYTLHKCTANILGFGNHYSKHSMMTMTLKNTLHVMWPSWIEVNYYSILYLRAPPHLKCCITGLSLRAGLIHASEMFKHPLSGRDPHS